MVTDRSGSEVERIGILGGTFDPVHYGHLRAAEEVRERFFLDKIIFMPAALPPHKRDRKVTAKEHRLEMVRKAVAGNPAFEVSDLECSREGASYSIETLKILKEGRGAGSEIYFILGSDAFSLIHTWRSYEDLFSMAHWIVVERPGPGKKGFGTLPESVRGSFRYNHGLKAWIHRSGHTLRFCKLNALNISASEIRKLVESGRSIRYLVPEEVRLYIETHGLYKEDSTRRE
jgi:nicotinate-nucleotide adenylyltransferase